MAATADAEQGSRSVEEALSAAKQARNAAFAGSLRVMAGVLRQDGDAKLAQAREMDAYAAAVERGEEGPPTPAMRVVMSLAPDDGADGADGGEESEVALVQLVGSVRGGIARVEEEGEAFTPEMREMLAGFASRFWQSPHFRAAINAAAEAGMPANARTAEWIANEIRRREG